MHIGIESGNKTRMVFVTPMGGDFDYSDRFNKITNSKTFQNRFSPVLIDANTK